MRTLWVCNVAGGPFTFTATKPGSTPLGLEEAHRELRISPEEFDEVAAELGRLLDHFAVPPREKEEVRGAFAHTRETTRNRWRRPERTRVHQSCRVYRERVKMRSVKVRRSASQERGWGLRHVLASVAISSELVEGFRRP